MENVGAMTTRKTRYDQMKAECISFHKKHPKVWLEFERLTFERIHRGFKHYGAKAIWEAVRWNIDVPGVDGLSSFKLNNNFPAFYSREFMKRHPMYNGFFRLRKQISEDLPPAPRPELGPDDYPEARI